MPDEEFPRSGFFCDLSRLYGGAVIPGGGPFVKIFQVGGFVVEQIYILYFFRNALIVDGIGAKGVGSGPGTSYGYFFIGNNTAFFIGIIKSLLQFFIKRGGDLVDSCSFGVHPAQVSSFPEQESPAVDAVLYAETLDEDLVVLYNHRFFSEGVKVQRITQMRIGQVKLKVDHLFEFGRRMQVQVLCAVE